MSRYKLLPINERREEARCWFCRTDKSVKYTGEILNPNLNSDHRYLKIYMCSRCAALHNDDLREEQIYNKPYVYAIRIFNKDGYQPMAELVFGDGGKPSGKTKIIRWDDVDERSKYMINAYTLIWDERDAVKTRSFEEYLGRTKNNYLTCDVLGYCPFDNKVEGFPCQDCPRKGD